MAPSAGFFSNHEEALILTSEGLALEVETGFSEVRELVMVAVTNLGRHLEVDGESEEKYMHLGETDKLGQYIPTCVADAKFEFWGFAIDSSKNFNGEENRYANPLFVVTLPNEEMGINGRVPFIVGGVDMKGMIPLTKFTKLRQNHFYSTVARKEEPEIKYFVYENALDLSEYNPKINVVDDVHNMRRNGVKIRHTDQGFFTEELEEFEHFLRYIVMGPKHTPDNLPTKSVMRLKVLRERMYWLKEALTNSMQIEN